MKSQFSSLSLQLFIIGNLLIDTLVNCVDSDEMPLVNSVDPDEMPYSVAFRQGQHCLLR